jgi:hydrogenase expression/formation protein HypE
LIAANIELHCLRDPTRGGLATALNELALDGGVGLEIDERAVPIHEGVAGACELLGLDPYYVACEGRLIAVVPESHAARALEVLRCAPGAADACAIGRVVADHPGVTVLSTKLGPTRLLDLLSGEQLPRIC